MVSETYVECLVARKASFAMRVLKTALIMLTAFFVVIGIAFIPGFLVAIVTGIGAYFAYMNADVEYEYLYLDREVSIDKVMAKSKRKRVAVYDVDRMEILAPMKSYRLDAYKNRELKTIDYSSGMDEGNKKYMMIYEGNVKILWEPSPEMMKAIHMVAPRKVFTD